jgi:hypothetical protein
MSIATRILLYGSSSSHWKGRDNCVLIMDTSSCKTDDDYDSCPIIAVARNQSEARVIAKALAPTATIEE